MRSRWVLIVLGLLSLVGYCGVYVLSKNFNWGEGYEQRPILEYLGLYFALFALQAGAIGWMIRKRMADRVTLILLIAFGLAFRFILLPSHQIQEDDIYRYMWDGKVLAHGINPYEYAPTEVSEFKFMQIREPELMAERYSPRSIEELEILYKLKWENATSLLFMERINHPDVPTIYPPLAQYVFRTVHAFKPDSILAMRLGFLVFDLAALGFIIALLLALNKNPNLCLIYFWSPLVIKETFNSTHLDIIGIACLCASLYFLVRQKYLLATGTLALSVLGKLYPVLLLPLYLKRMAYDSPEARLSLKEPALNTLVFGAVLGLAYWPFLNIGSGAFQGLRTFSVYWQNNDSLFALLTYFFKNVLHLTSENEVWLSYDLPSMLAKGVVALTLLAGLFVFVFRRPVPARGDIRDIFIMMTLVFLLSPVQNPWYLSWVVPFLCVFPVRALILLTGLVGMYYLDFYFDYQDLPQYVKWIPWMEYLPFYALLAWDGWNRFKERDDAGAGRAG